MSSAEPRPPEQGSAYDILGAPPSADARELKLRYHQIAREWHPDISTRADAGAVFARIAQAYEIVTHPQQKLVYDFVIANEIPLSAPDRFQAFYAKASKIDILIRHRHRIGWAITGVLAGSAALARWSCLPRKGATHPELASAPDDSAATSAVSFTSDAPTHPLASASHAAGGGLAGAACGGGAILAHGVSGALGARLTLAAAAGGALGGRILATWLEARIGHMRVLRTRAAGWLLEHGREICELAGGGVGLLLLRRASPALRLVESHLRALRAGTLGVLAGQLVGRLAVRDHDHAGAGPDFGPSARLCSHVSERRL